MADQGYNVPYMRMHETPMPSGVFPDLKAATVSASLDPKTQCLRCFGPLGFTLVRGVADACQGCTPVLARTEGLTTVHLRRHVAALANHYHFPLLGSSSP